MPTARYTADGGIYRVGGHHFEPGDGAEVDDELAAHLGTVDDFDVLDESDAGDEEDPVAEPPLNPADFSVDELREALQDGDYDGDELDTIAGAEAAGKDRSTAHDAIDAAREG